MGRYITKDVEGVPNLFNNLGELLDYFKISEEETSSVKSVLKAKGYSMADLDNKLTGVLPSYQIGDVSNIHLENNTLVVTTKNNGVAKVPLKKIIFDA